MYVVHDSKAPLISHENPFNLDHVGIWVCLSTVARLVSGCKISSAHVGVPREWFILCVWVMRARMSHDKSNSVVNVLRAPRAQSDILLRSRFVTTDSDNGSTKLVVHTWPARALRLIKFAVKKWILNNKSKCNKHASGALFKYSYSWITSYSGLVLNNVTLTLTVTSQQQSINVFIQFIRISKN